MAHFHSDQHADVFIIMRLWQDLLWRTGMTIAPCRYTCTCCDESCSAIKHMKLQQQNHHVALIWSIKLFVCLFLISTVDDKRHSIASNLMLRTGWSLDLSDTDCFRRFNVTNQDQDPCSGLGGGGGAGKGGGTVPIVTLPLLFMTCAKLVLGTVWSLDLFDTNCLHRELLTGTKIKISGVGWGMGWRMGTVLTVTLPSLFLNCSELVLKILWLLGLRFDTSCPPEIYRPEAR